MSTSFSRSAGSMATRKVIGWSLPRTLPTWANPRSESARDTRSTADVSTRNVSTRVPGPNTRAMDAESLAGGGAGFWTASKRKGRRIATSELEADAEAHDFALADARRVAHDFVVALERRVPGGLVRQAKRGEAPRERPVTRHPGRHGSLRVVTLVARERVELLG